jgi:hypothetical protein
MTAGDAYSQEKQIKTEVNNTITLRDRKKYEKGIKNALESFKVVSFYDDLDYEVIENGMKIKVPNIPVIKSLIESTLRKQIEENNSKNKLSGFVTMKCLFIVSNSDENTTEQSVRFFNSDTTSFNSSKMIGGFINNMVSYFENFLEKWTIKKTLEF